ncbi:FAD-dependent oxidoreductase [Microbacterium halophytorum]|uniref:FAD-dependent oxidoreductase n=1 Tax=Microbacterium halophytorum TaxID=2067568 RepID=UPI000CFBBECB|nr:FAD-dependent oxidoreductase [Microbacterium halophytorum]
MTQRSTTGVGEYAGAGAAAPGDAYRVGTGAVAGGNDSAGARAGAAAGTGIGASGAEGSHVGEACAPGSEEEVRMSEQNNEIAGGGPLRVVLVGFGPVGVRFAEELLPAIEAGDVALTVIGAEDCEPYNRIMVAEYAAGSIARDELVIADTAELEARGVRVLRGRAAARIDRDAREVVLEPASDAGTGSSTNGSAAPGAREPQGSSAIGAATAGSALPGGETGSWPRGEADSVPAADRIPYDRLVLATGADATVPRLDGLEVAEAGPGREAVLTDGVCAMRTVGDAERARDVIASGGRVAVLGAGVLGIELALLIADAGAGVQLAHFGPAPMPRQLDRGSAHVLVGALAEAGVDVVPHTRAEAIITREVGGRRRFAALVSGDGKRIDADLLVLSCGVRPRTALAAEAGLRAARGVLVDDRLRSWSDPAIFAIGDVAHVADAERYAHEKDVPGGPSGLVGPGWRQAEQLARDLAREAAAIAGAADEIADDLAAADDSAGIVMLKSRSIDLVQAGGVVPDPFAPVAHGEPPSEIAAWADPQHGTYLAMSTRDGVLEAFVAIGLPRAAAELSVLHQRRGELPSDRSLLLRLDAADEPAPASGPDATVCVCNAVTVGRIDEAVAGGCSTVAEVGAETRAGTGCGGCRSRIEEMLADYAGAAA